MLLMLINVRFFVSLVANCQQAHEAMRLDFLSYRKVYNKLKRIIVF